MAGGGGGARASAFQAVILIDELIQERIASLDAASAQKAALLAAQRKTQGRTVDRHDNCAISATPA